MELKKYFIFIIILNFTNFLHADMIKPAKNLTAFDVIKIQLNALKKTTSQIKTLALSRLGYLLTLKIKKLQDRMKGFKKCYLEINITFY